MKAKSIFPIGITLALAGGFGVYLTLSPDDIELIDTNTVTITEPRTSLTPLSKLLEPDTTTLLNTTSQYQLLLKERDELESQIDVLKQQVSELVVQRNVLIEEATPYTDFVTLHFLTPLTELKSQIEQHLSSSTTLDAIHIIEAINATVKPVEQYLNNPNETTYEESIETAFKLIDDELASHEVDSVISVASEVIHSGYTNTKSRMKLQEAKNLLEEFERTCVETTSADATEFKKSKQQQSATEDALSLKALQLDELALELSGILDEIEEILN